MQHPWGHIDELLARALDVPAADRDRFVDEECADDPALRRTVRELLAASTGPEDFLAPGRLQQGKLWSDLGRYLTDGSEIGPGSVVGCCRLVREIGRGGMAVVYLADRLDGGATSPVAVKLLRLGADDPDVIRRFRKEREILAALEHPGIARFIDAGVAIDDRPYLVMEYVEGEPIDRYCDRKRLDTGERLRLFLDIADALQHAHRNLVVHRDLKPSNILVDAEGRAKLLDFGIAKPVDDSAVTQTLARMLTPQYASPEQILGGQVTTASDIYQLGLLLYELLTGAPPYRVQDRAIDELTRVVCQRDPVRPSASLATRGADDLQGVAEARRVRPERLRRILSGDLDAIVMMALRKDPARRYQTVEQLAHDIRRHLESLPVIARPERISYLVGSFLRRHRKAALAAAAVLVAVSGMIAYHADRLSEERDLAKREAENARAAEAQARVEAAKAEQIAGFIQGIFLGVDPAEAGALDKTLVRRLLDVAASRVETELAGQPDVGAAIRHTIGVSYSALGEYEPAHEQLSAALDLWRLSHGPGSPEELASVAELALVQRRLGRYEKAEGLLAGAVAGLRANYGDEHPETLSAAVNLASLERLIGRYDSAERLYLEVLEACRRVLGDDHRDTLTVANNLALLYHEQGDFDRAEPLFVEVLDKSRAIFGTDHPDTLNSLNNLAMLHEMQGRFEAAEKLYLEALDGSRRVMGPDHPETLNTMNNLAVLYGNQGRLEESERLHRRVLGQSRRVLGADHPDTLNSMSNLALLVSRLGRSEEAYELLRSASAAAHRSLPPSSVLRATIASNYGEVLTEFGRFAEAEAQLREAQAVFEQTLGPDHALTETNETRLGKLDRRR